MNTVAWVETNTPNMVDPSGMIYEHPAFWDTCNQQIPETPTEAEIMENARNATIVIRTVNYENDTFPKTCDPREFENHPERFWISGAGLGTLTEKGLWTHDHFENNEQQRTEGDLNQALENISTHDCVQFIGGGQGRELMVMTHGVKVTSLTRTSENLILLLSNILNFDNSPISLTQIATTVPEGSFSFGCTNCNRGVLYAHFIVSLSVRREGDNILQALWRNVGIGRAGMDTDDGLLPQPIPLEDGPEVIFGYRVVVTF